MSEAYTGAPCLVSKLAETPILLALRWPPARCVVMPCKYSFLDLCCSIGIIDLLAVMSTAVRL